ncbi:MAG: hypothetical protein IAE85_01300 [Anaerolinea sp.]|nr:hypothetical protein [Anaerolinea sp.]
MSFPSIARMVLVLTALVAVGAAPVNAAGLASPWLAAQVNTPYPILFVSQAPIPEDFTTIGAPANFIHGCVPRAWAAVSAIRGASSF